MRKYISLVRRLAELPPFVGRSRRLVTSGRTRIAESMWKCARKGMESYSSVNRFLCNFIAVGQPQRS